MFIRDRLAGGPPSISFEFFPPKSDEAAAQLEVTIAELRPLEPAFVSVTWGAGGSTREKTIDMVARIRRDTGIEAMAHLTCVGARREELGAIIHRLAEAGVQNILALRGDPPAGSDTFVAVEGGFRHASELVAFVREVHGHGISVGGAAYPETHVESASPVEDLDNLKRKVDAGLDFLITQLFFDNRHYWDFVERARAAHIDIPIVPGIMPITNAAQVHRFTTQCGTTLPNRLATEIARRGEDRAAIQLLGVQHATAQCIDLLGSGAPGIHFYTLNRSRAARDIFTVLKSMSFPIAGQVSDEAAGEVVSAL
jgi:methylenetetrahydrofolate reductase (NADPH)